MNIAVNTIDIDITFHMIASQLSGYCDIISNWLWHHQQNMKWVSETRRQCVKIVDFIIIYGFIIACKKWNNICNLVMNCLCAHWSVILVFIFLAAMQLRKKKQSNLLMSTWTVHHFTTNIILYIYIFDCEIHWSEIYSSLYHSAWYKYGFYSVLMYNHILKPKESSVSLHFKC